MAEITALPNKLFDGTHREVDREGDHATAGGTLPVAYVPRWNN